MLSAEELAELRTLHARAYGRDGGLTPADATRLHELEDRRAEATTGVPVVDPAEEARGSGVPSAAEHDDAPALDRERGPEPEALSTPPEVRSSRRLVSWRLGALAVAAALVFGLGLGWMLFGQRGGPAIPLTADRVERQSELYQAGDYDEGSLVPVAEDGEVLVWMATAGGGARVCLILEVGEQSSSGCQRAEEARKTGVNAFVTVEGPKIDGESGTYESTGIGATMLYSVSDEPMVAINRWDNSASGLLDQYDEEQRPRAEQLMAEGYNGEAPTLIGFFRNASVWVVATTDGSEKCLIVDGAPDVLTVCEEAERALADGISGGFTVFDGEEGTGSGESWNFEVRFTQWQVPYLTVTSGDAQRVEVGTEDGDER